MKKHDFILIGIILGISLIILVTLLCFFNKKAKYANVYLNGEVILQIDLSEDKKYVVNGNISEVEIEVKDGKIGIIDSDCHDHTCINMGFTNSTARTIICMPNGIYIKVIDSIDEVDVVIG